MERLLITASLLTALIDRCSYAHHRTRLAIPRMKSILPAMVKQGYLQPIDWEGNLSCLYYDLAGNPAPEVLHSFSGREDAGNIPTE